MSVTREFGKGKSKITVPFKAWQVRADSIRKLNRVGKDHVPGAAGGGSVLAIIIGNWASGCEALLIFGGGPAPAFVVANAGELSTDRSLGGLDARKRKDGALA